MHRHPPRRFRAAYFAASTLNSLACENNASKPSAAGHRARWFRRRCARVPARLQAATAARRRARRASRRRWQTSRSSPPPELVTVRVVASFDQPGHHAAQIIVHHLRGAAETVGGLAVPDRQQQVAMPCDERAGLRVLPVALDARLRDVDRRVSREQRQLDHVRRAHSESNAACVSASVKSCAYISRGSGNGAISRAPHSSPASATS